VSASLDVLVAGGGPVGWACALAAKTALGKRARVAVIERDPLPQIANGARLSARVYTVAAGNLLWFEALGVRFDAARSASVTDMLVHGRDGRASLRISANDAGQRELAQVIEHEALAAATAARAQALGVQLIKGECVALHDSDPTDGGAHRLVELADKSLLSTRLLLAADGTHSRVREAAGLAASTRPYAQRGVVANMICATPHRDTARQWFLPDGSILALLPLPSINGAAAVSMVWSVPPARADVLCALPTDALLAEINTASANALGVCEVVGAARQFPLTLLRLPDPVAPRFLAVGDAAHAMHPLAGQGVNVGLADARCLADVLPRAGEVHDDPGHALLLARYRRERFGPTFAMQLATDSLFRLYNQSEHPLLMAAGDAGMRLFGHLPAFRRTLSSTASQ
jgi:ubiquinone biosynthesis UbiH/UbiF/VisC/COQ6 family hydroxylase